MGWIYARSNTLIEHDLGAAAVGLQGKVGGQIVVATCECQKSLEQVPLEVF